MIPYIQHIRQASIVRYAQLWRISIYKGEFMKNILNHLKTSGIGTTSGMACYAGVQYINSAISDGLLRALALFGLMTTLSVCSKLVMDRVAAKKDS
jgi:hypothetical protein